MAISWNRPWISAGAAVLILSSASLLAGCSEQTVAPSPTAPRSDPAATASLPTGIAKSAEYPPPPLVATIGDRVPPGRQVLALTGRGNQTIRMPVASTGQDVTLRVSCAGSGPLDIVDSRGVSLLSLTGCSPVAAYGTSLSARATGADINVAAPESTAWRLGVWMTG